MAAPQKHKYLVYGSPSAVTPPPEATRITATADIDFRHVGTHVSFLDYDLVLTFAGGFERRTYNGRDLRQVDSINIADLDRRMHEISTLVNVQHKTIVFLVGRMPVIPVAGMHGYRGCDLWREEMDGRQIAWHPVKPSVPCPTTDETCFHEFLNNYGLASNQFIVPDHLRRISHLLVGNRDYVFGFCIDSQYFLLPCREPTSPDEIYEIGLSAIRGTIQYQALVAGERPEWLENVTFVEETSTLKDLEVAESKCKVLREKLALHRDRKELLFETDDLLVELVLEVLNSVFKLKSTLVPKQEKPIEDIHIKVGEQIVALFEVKGVGKNVSNADINQVQDHRKRNFLDDMTPGILIVNTFRSSKTWKEKLQVVNADQVKKAVLEKVLILRTLDVIRLVNRVQSGIMTSEDVRDILFNKVGWLEVTDDAMNFHPE